MPQRIHRIQSLQEMSNPSGLSYTRYWVKSDCQGNERQFHCEAGLLPAGVGCPVVTLTCRSLCFTGFSEAVAALSLDMYCVIRAMKGFRRCCSLGIRMKLEAHCAAGSGWPYVPPRC